MRVLVVGGAGFIGSRVVRLLADEGHDVTVFRRGKTPAELPDGVREMLGDRNEKSDLQQLEADVVLDVIPLTERQATDLVEALAGRADRVVALSSADVYRNYDGLRGKAAAAPDPVPLSEDAPLRESFYPYRGEDIGFEYADDYEKILVEKALMGQTGLPAAVLRLPAVYGPGDRQHRLRPYLAQMTADRPRIALGQAQAGWRWSRAYVDNVAAAVKLAITNSRSSGRIYNVGDEPTLTEIEWAQAIADAAGWEGEVVTSDAEEAAGPPLNWRYDLWTDTTRIRKELGYEEPVGSEQALERSVAWEREAMSREGNG